MINRCSLQMLVTVFAIIAFGHHGLKRNVIRKYYSRFPASTEGTLRTTTQATLRERKPCWLRQAWVFVLFIDCYLHSSVLLMRNTE